MRIINQRPKVIDKYELSRYSTKPPSLFALGRSHTEKIGMKPKVTKRHGSNLITITVEPISQKIGARGSFPASPCLAIFNPCIQEKPSQIGSQNPLSKTMISYSLGEVYLQTKSTMQYF